MHDKRNDVHRGNLTRVRSGINNGWSSREEQRLAPSRRNAKKDQIQADRNRDIDKENIRLLLRMHEIDSHKRTERRSASVPPPPRDRAAGSNNGARMKELNRIDAENKRMLGRLRTATSSVSISKLEEQHKSQQRIMQMRCCEEPMQNPRAVRVQGRPPMVPRSASASRLPPLVPSGQSPSSEDRCALEEDLGSERSGGSRPASGSRGYLHDADANSPAPAPRQTTPRLHEGSMGLNLPEASRRLAARLLAADDAEREAAESAASAKEAANRAFRDACSMETGDGDPLEDMLGYNEAVRLHGDAMARRRATSLQPIR